MFKRNGYVKSNSVPSGLTDKDSINNKKPFGVRTAMGFLNRFFGARALSHDKKDALHLAPSEIHFLSSKQSGVLSEQSLGSNYFDSYSRVTRETAKLQVVKKDGHWFALNSTQLQLCRLLEIQGRCTQVKLDVVCIKDVPKQFMQMMIPPSKHDDAEPDMTSAQSDRHSAPVSCSDLAYCSDIGDESLSTECRRSVSWTSKGYHKLQPASQSDQPIELHDDDVTDDEADSDEDEDESEYGSSIFDPSDSDNEWLDDGSDNDVIETESDDATTDDEEQENTENNDENECLL